ncbi:MAG TPA: hypothetical protein VF988_08090 [Verrucomicrobiae bacterium]
MKTALPPAATRSVPKARRAGVMLIECLVYIAVFAVLLGVAFGAFYVCWDHTRALVAATDDIGAALRAGERWRADLRTATGKISLETTPQGELLRIPHGKDEIFYSLHNGTLRRKPGAAAGAQVIFEKVTTSQMQTETRDGVTAWRWELELPLRWPDTQLPLLFTFEAVSKS